MGSSNVWRDCSLTALKLKGPRRRRFLLPFTWNTQCWEQCFEDNIAFGDKPVQSTVHTTVRVTPSYSYIAFGHK